MRIQIDKIELDVWENGYPKWFHIQDGDNMITFTLKQAPMIRDALTNLIKLVEN